MDPSETTTPLPQLDKPALLDAYRKMVLIRRFEEVVIELRLAGRIYGPVHPYIGQEAIAVGVCTTLKPRDQITSTHRGHGHCLAKGASPSRMMAELFGRQAGYCRGKGGSMHIADFKVGMLGANGIVGAGIPIAAGAALAAQIGMTGTVVVAFFGDGATGEGVFHETLNIAALWKLPLVLVCENNQYGGQGAAHITRLRPRITISHHGAAYGIPGLTVDGNSLSEVWEAANTAVARARAGEGPTLIECQSYRTYPHSYRDQRTPDARPPEERQRWASMDPLILLEQALLRASVVDAGSVAEARRVAEAQVSEAVDFAEASPFPEPAEALDDVFASPI